MVGVGYDPRAWIPDFAYYYGVFMLHPSIEKLHARPGESLGR